MKICVFECQWVWLWRDSLLTERRICEENERRGEIFFSLTGWNIITKTRCVFFTIGSAPSLFFQSFPFLSVCRAGLASTSLRAIVLRGSLLWQVQPPPSLKHSPWSLKSLKRLVTVLSYSWPVNLLVSTNTNNIFLFSGHKQLNDKQHSYQQAPSDSTHCGACQPVWLPNRERWLQDQGNSRGMVEHVVQKQTPVSLSVSWLSAYTQHWYTASLELPSHFTPHFVRSSQLVLRYKWQETCSPTPQSEPSPSLVLPSR